MTKQKGYEGRLTYDVDKFLYFKYNEGRQSYTHRFWKFGPKKHKKRTLLIPPEKRTTRTTDDRSSPSPLPDHHHLSRFQVPGFRGGRPVVLENLEHLENLVFKVFEVVLENLDHLENLENSNFKIDRVSGFYDPLPPL